MKSSQGERKLGISPSLSHDKHLNLMAQDPGNSHQSLNTKITYAFWVRQQGAGQSPLGEAQSRTGQQLQPESRYILSLSSGRWDPGKKVLSSQTSGVALPSAEQAREPSHMPPPHTLLLGQGHPHTQTDGSTHSFAEGCAQHSTHRSRTYTQVTRHQ